VRITQDFTLIPVVTDSVVYARYIRKDTDDTKKYRLISALVARWHKFAKEHSTGKDAFGRYYDSKAHASRVIRDFKVQEQQRVREMPPSRHQR